MNDDIKVEPTKPTTETKTVASSDAPSADDYGLLRMQGYFNIGGEPTAREREQLKLLWEYLSKESEFEGEPIYKLKQIENRIGTPTIGETRLSKLYRFAKVDLDIKQKMKERDEIAR